jgi:molybdopterin-binding protein
VAREFYKVGEAARLLGISQDTLRRWDREGRIMTERDDSNRRIVPISEVERLRPVPEQEAGLGNTFAGVVTAVETDGLMAQVELVVAQPVRLVSIVTRDAVEELELRPGVKVNAVVRPNSVVLMIPTAPHDAAI